MTAADWVALVTPAVAVAGIGVAGIVKLTRLVDAVDRLAVAMEHITGKIQDHESRINTLEGKP
jgi:hypothetical protein